MRVTSRQTGILLLLAVGVCGAPCGAEVVPLNTSVRTIDGRWGYKDLTCTVGGRAYRGIGFPQPPYADGFACFSIVGYDRFQAFAAIQEKPGCSATLIVALDGNVVWQKQMHNGDPVVPLDIPLTGHHVMRLERRMKGDGADFLEPKLILAQSAEPTRPTSKLLYPLDGISNNEQVLSSLLGYGKWLYGLPGFPSYNGSQVHAAVDIGSTLDAPVYAVAEGTVDSNTGIHGGFGPGWSSGGVVVIRSLGTNGIPYYIIYGHTQPPHLAVGSHVTAGERIGEIGPWLVQDGGPHLHLSVRLRPLPAQGWGAPTVAGKQGKPGCEYVGSPQEVVDAGYRDPMNLFDGQLLAELRVGAGAPEAVRDRLLDRYRAGYYPDLRAGNLDPVPDGSNHIGRPADDEYLRAARVARLGAGYLQTFQRYDGQFTGLAVGDTVGQAFWVHGAMWASYASGGGPGVFGYPASEEYDVPQGRTQRFEKATFVWNRETGLTNTGR